MKVKVGDKVYSAEETPVAVILTDQDKKNIAAMLPECTTYCSCPDGFDTQKILEWMADDGVPSSPVRGPRPMEDAAMTKEHFLKWLASMERTINREVVRLNRTIRGEAEIKAEAQQFLINLVFALLDPEKTVKR